MATRRVSLSRSLKCLSFTRANRFGIRCLLVVKSHRLRIQVSLNMLIASKLESRRFNLRG